MTQNSATTPKGLEFVEIATADPATLEQLLQQLNFRMVGVHRSKSVKLYRQGTLNVIVNAEADCKLFLKNQVSGSQIKALAVRVDNAKLAYEELLHKGAWGCSSSPGAMELNIPGIEITGGAVLYLINNYNERFSIYDIDFTPVTPQDQPSPVFNKIESLSLSIAPQHYKQWQDLFTQLLHFSVQNEKLISPDKSFSLILKSIEDNNITDEGISAIRLSTQKDQLDTLEPFLPDYTDNKTGFRTLKNLPEGIDFSIEVEV
ncbi:MAG: hypothetical protein GYB20_19550 [Oceanospirillales bacterium]|nr:hypothetical protein [Oceanospirillales bacterium]MBR9889884.1 hypothetical protein [Oceanospirillales bacterium]